MKLEISANEARGDDYLLIGEPDLEKAGWWWVRGDDTGGDSWACTLNYMGRQHLPKATMIVQSVKVSERSAAK